VSRRRRGGGTVLFIGNFLSASIGSRSVCEDLAERLTSHYDVLVTSQEKSKILRLLDMLRTVLRERRNFDLAHVDVYSGRAFVWAELVTLTLGLLGKPYVLTLHGGNLPSFARRWPWRMRRLLRAASTVTTPSRYLMEELQRFRSDVCIIPNAVDLRRYRFVHRVRPRCRIVWVRSFHAIYNPLLAIRVVGELVQRVPEVHLEMIGPDRGDGTYHTVAATIERLELGKSITIRGAVSKREIPHSMDSGDIFINTANIDNTPVSVIEAMASGLCVVSTDVGGIRYLIKDGENGLLVPPDDPQAMAAAVERLLIDPQLASRLSRGGRRQASEFDWETVLPRWERIFGQVLARVDV
jgi:glycosyltransferase involved in cell wall biosynthesis